MERLTVTIDGMSCEHCIRTVDDALKELTGVTVEQVTIGKAVVSYDPASASPARISQAIEDEGYAVVETR